MSLCKQIELCTEQSPFFLDITRPIVPYSCILPRAPVYNGKIIVDFSGDICFNNQKVMKRQQLAAFGNLSLPKSCFSSLIWKIRSGRKPETVNRSTAIRERGNMSALQSIRKEFGRDVCRRCLNQLCQAQLEGTDCVYGDPYPRRCPCCGEMRHIVSGLRLSGRLKLFGKAPDFKE